MLFRSKEGPFNLGVAGTVSASAAGEAAPGDSEENGAGEQEEAASGNAGEGRFVVVGSSGWVANNILRFNGNRDLVLNMMNWLSSDEDLISIRPKEPGNRPLNMTRQQMSTVFYSSVVFLPVLIIAAGIGVWWRRR